MLIFTTGGEVDGDCVFRPAENGTFAPIKRTL
jgi:hypothetical protein